MARIALAVVCLVLVAAGAQATTLDLAFDNKSAQLQLAQPLVVDELGSSEAGARFLYNGDEDTRLGSLGLVFLGEPGNIPGLKLGIGVHGYLGRTDQGQDLLAAALGARVRYAPPTLGGITLLGRLNMAPGIFCGLDSERLWETEIRAGYNLTPRVQVHLGYQNIQVRFDGYSSMWTIDHAIRLGFQASF